MVGLLEMYVRDLWDDRHWSVALLSKDPSGAYAKIKEESRSLREGGEDALAQVPPELRDWYRST